MSEAPDTIPTPPRPINPPDALQPGETVAALLLDAMDALDALAEVRHAFGDLVRLDNDEVPISRIVAGLATALMHHHADARETVRRALAAARERGV